MDKPEAGFWAAIADAPDDGLPKLLFADWLDERRDPRGDCLRWVAAENKRPAYDRHDTKTWDWWSNTPLDPMHYEPSPRDYVLPLNLFSRLTPVGPGLWKGDPTFIVALPNLGAAWRAGIDEGGSPLADDRPPLIYLAPDDTTAARFAGFSHGADAVAGKSATSDEFLAQVRVLERWQRARDRWLARAAEAHQFSQQLQNAYQQIDLDLRM